MKAEMKRLYSDVNFLTTVHPARNYQNLEVLEEVATYIKNEMINAGAEPIEQKWMAEGNEYKNIIASYNPDKTKRLIVGAHYDVAGNQPGADDNASAVAGLLELVRMIYTQKPVIDYRIEFVAFNLEEPPFFATHSMGSYVHAQSLFKEGADVMGMICLEMIGYFSDVPHSQPFPTPELAKLYPHTANFIIVVGIDKYTQFNNKVHSFMSKDSGIDVQVIHFGEGDGLAGLSDQRNYWKFGYPALMINDTSFIRNPNYHTTKDTIDTLDFKKMTEVVNSTYRAIINMK